MLGGGAGSIQNMVTTLRNNKAMLRKRKFLNNDKSPDKANRKNLSQKAKAERLLFRKKKLQNATFEKKTTRIITTSLILGMLILGGYYYFQLQNRKTLTEQHLRQSTQNKQLTKYNSFLKEGDMWLLQNKWRAAILQYRKAITIFPKKFEANYRLALVYSYQCKYENESCDKAINLTNTLKRSFPQRAELEELQKIITN